MATITDWCIFCESPIRQSQIDGAWEDERGACGCGDGEHHPARPGELITDLMDKENSRGV